MSFWLWLTVIFANIAEAVAEGRGKAQADTLRATRTTTLAHRRTDAGAIEEVGASDLQRGDHVLVRAGEVIPPTATWWRAPVRSTSRPSPVSRHPYP